VLRLILGAKLTSPAVQDLLLSLPRKPSAAMAGRIEPTSE
jgi:hypothetical protein